MNPVAVGFALGLLGLLTLGKQVPVWVGVVGMMALAVCAAELVGWIAKESA